MTGGRIVVMDNFAYILNSNCVENFNSPDNGKFILGVYCDLIGKAPNTNDYEFYLNALNNKSLTRSDIIDILTRDPLFIERYNVLDLYYTYGVNPPSKEVFISSTMPSVNSKKSVLSTFNILGGTYSQCPSSNFGYGATVGHQDITTSIFNSAAFAARYGGEVKTFSSLNFYSWVGKQNCRVGDSRSTWFFAINEAAKFIDLIESKGSTGKPFAMAYVARFIATISEAKGCTNCASNESDYYGFAVKFRRHLNAVIVNYLLRGVWVNTRTNWTISKQTNFLFSLPGGCDKVNIGTLDTNFRNYVTSNILSKNDWGENCCYGGVIPSSSSSSSSSNGNNWNINIITTDSNQTFGLQLNGTGANITVDWGDGVIETFTSTGNKTKIYASPGNYTVKISGSFSSNGNIRLGTTSNEKARVQSTSIIPLIPGLISFDSCFQGCTSLTSIPVGIFTANTAVTSFAFCFNNCSSLTSIPANLFSNNTLVTNFVSCFDGCTSLTSIPADLFANNTLVTNFTAVFFGVSLTTTSYSNLLINMASNANIRENGVQFGGGNSRYNCDGQIARQTLQAKSWLFNDLGLEGTCDTSSSSSSSSSFTFYDLSGVFLSAGTFNNVRTRKFGDSFIHDEENPTSSRFRRGNLYYAPIVSANPIGGLLNSPYGIVNLSDVKEMSNEIDASIWGGWTGTTFSKAATNLTFNVRSNLNASRFNGYSLINNPINASNLGSVYTNVAPPFAWGTTARALSCAMDPQPVDRCRPEAGSYRSECWDDKILSDWVYVSYQAQTRKGYTSIKLFSQLSGILSPWLENSSLFQSQPCVCPEPEKVWEIIFNRDSINSQPDSILNLDTFPGTMAYLFCTENKNEFGWNFQSISRFKSIKDNIQNVLQNSGNVYIYVTTECCTVETIKDLCLTTVPGDINNLTTTIIPESLPCIGYNDSNISTFDEYFVTNEPDKLSYFRFKTGGADTPDFQNDVLFEQPCALSIFTNSVSSPTLTYQAGAGFGRKFFNGFTLPLVADAMGVVSLPNSRDNAVFNLPGSRAPQLNKGYKIRVDWNSWSCDTNSNSISNSLVLTATSLPGFQIYWPKEFISTYPGPGTTGSQNLDENGLVLAPSGGLPNVNLNAPDSIFSHNGVSLRSAGFGNNVNLFEIKKLSNVSFDLSVRGDQLPPTFDFASLNGNTRWGLMTRCPNKNPFDPIRVSFFDRDLPFNTNLRLNKLLYQWVQKIKETSGVKTSSTFDPKEIFIKEGSDFMNVTFSPRLLYPLEVGPFSKNILLSGFLYEEDINPVFDYSYTIGIKVVNNNNILVGKEYILIDSGNIYSASVEEVPEGYIRSSFNDKLLIKNNYKYLTRGEGGGGVTLPIFEDIEYGNTSYLRESQKYHLFDAPIFIPSGHSFQIQIYSSNIGYTEERSLNGEAIPNRYLLPKIETSSFDNQEQYTFSPLCFKILDIPVIEDEKPPIKIKKIDFYNITDDRFKTIVDVYSGHGIISSENQVFFGNISDPTGLQPAVYFDTGILTANIEEGSGSYTWQNLQLSGSGKENQVYLNYVTGEKPAQNIIEFIDSTGFGLQDGDYISIADFLFFYNTSANDPTQFNSPENLLNNLNSGATGAFNNQGYDLLQTLVGVTGYQIDNKLFLYSYLRKGSSGNNIRVYRDSSNLNAIKIHNRYFTGGESYRPIINSWIGSFAGVFNITIENSGYYTKYIEPTESFQNISGLFWEDNFSGNYIILTGLKDPRNPQGYSGIKILFNTGLNQFSGSSTIPRNQSTIFTGLNIEILKPNPYNISGNKFEYIISGNNIFYQEILEG
jgi:hypothetical protein